MVFKRNQIVVLSLVLMIVVAGYLQYSYKQSSMSASSKDSGKIGEAVYVDNDLASGKTVEQNSEERASSIQTGADTKVTSNAKASGAVGASKQANDFFTQAKLDREISRGRDADALEAITKDEAASKEAKSKAYEQRMKIIQNSDKEMRLETLIKEKGFSEVLALFGDDGGIDIVVKSPNLTSAQTAQISDIVTRQANVPITKIRVKNIY